MQVRLGKRYLDKLKLYNLINHRTRGNTMTTLTAILLAISFGLLVTVISLVKTIHKLEQQYHIPPSTVKWDK